MDVNEKLEIGDEVRFNHVWWNDGAGDNNRPNNEYHIHFNKEQMIFSGTKNITNISSKDGTPLYQLNNIHYKYTPSMLCKVYKDE